MIAGISYDTIVNTNLRVLPFLPHAQGGFCLRHAAVLLQMSNMEYVWIPMILNLHAAYT